MCGQWLSSCECIPYLSHLSSSSLRPQMSQTLTLRRRSSLPAPSQSGSPIITGIGSSVTNGYTHVNFIANPGNLHYNMDVLSLLIHLNGCKIKKISALVFYPWYRGHLVKWRLYSDDNTILVAISESSKLTRVRGKFGSIFNCIFHWNFVQSIGMLCVTVENINISCLSRS